MNAQEIYNPVRDHLLKQGARSVSVNGYGGCEYRSDDGLKCAVGCLIPDEMYSTRLEGRGVRSEEVIRVLKNAGVLDGIVYSGRGDERLNMLDELQNIHDRKTPDVWAEHLNSVAAKYGLQP